VKRASEDGSGSGCFLLQAKAQPTKTTTFASIIFDLNLRSNYLLKSLISINLLFINSLTKAKIFHYYLKSSKAFVKFNTFFIVATKHTKV